MPEIGNDYKKKIQYIMSADETDDSVAKDFEDMLSQLPNNGKLYKYRALKGFHDGELKDKYLWFSSAKKLNDNKDCCFNVNFYQERDKLVAFFMNKANYKKLVVNSLYKHFRKKNAKITKQKLEELFEGSSGRNDEAFAVEVKNFCVRYSLNSSQRKELLETIKLFNCDKQRELTIKKTFNELCVRMENIRKRILVCSLASSYSKDNMWAYYCNNKGICIEYDFSKIRLLDHKKIFHKMRKVKYGKKTKYSFINAIKSDYGDDCEEKNREDDKILRQFLTKEKSWSTEEEWRAIVFSKVDDVGVQVPVDFISAVYIDYSVLRWKKAKEIIKLAKENAWQVYVRYFDPLVFEYKYDTIDNTKKAIRQMKLITNEVK